MVRDADLRCANCQIPIHWRPTIVDGKPYCCMGCAQGGPCDCDYRHLPRWERSCAIVVQVSHDLTIKHNLSAGCIPKGARDQHPDKR